MSKATVWFHKDTFTIGLLEGNNLTFVWNNKFEESYFEFIRKDWEMIGEL